MNIDSILPVWRVCWRVEQCQTVKGTSTSVRFKAAICVLCHSNKVTENDMHWEVIKTTHLDFALFKTTQIDFMNMGNSPQWKRNWKDMEVEVLGCCIFRIEHLPNSKNVLWIWNFRVPDLISRNYLMRVNR